MAVTRNTIYNTIKDLHWYEVQGIRRGGNDDDRCAFCPDNNYLRLLKHKNK